MKPLCKFTILPPSDRYSPQTKQHNLAPCPGVPQQNGLITPAWWRRACSPPHKGPDQTERKASKRVGSDRETKPETELAVLLDRRTARKIALAVLAHLSAWATATYYQRIADNTWQPPREAVVDPETGEIIS